MYIPALWKQFFVVVETYIFNESFIPACGVRFFV